VLHERKLRNIYVLLSMSKARFEELCLSR